MSRVRMFWVVVFFYVLIEVLSAVVVGLNSSFFIRNALGASLLYFIFDEKKWANTVYLVLLWLSVVLSIILVLMNLIISMYPWIYVLGMLGGYLVQLIYMTKLRKLDFAKDIIYSE